MTQPGLIDQITRIAAPAAHALGLEIWGIEIIPAGRVLVRIYVDTPANVSPNVSPGVATGAPEASAGEGGMREDGGRGPNIDACAALSRHVGLALEAEDILSHAYVLEVSSPGLDRLFFAPAQLPPYVGKELELELARPRPDMPGRKRLRGELRAVDGPNITLRPQDAPEDSLFAWEDVRKIRLVPELPFSNTEKPGKKPGGQRKNASAGVVK